MSRAPFASIPIIGEPYEKFMEKYRAGKEKQSVMVRAGMEAVVRGVPQGCLMGVVSFQFSKMMMSDDVKAQMDPAQRKKLEQTGAMTPKSMPVAILSFAALFATQYALVEIIKHYRKKKDTWNVVIPAAGGGAAFALAQGQPGQILPLALGFAGFTAVFDKIGLSPGDETGKADQKAMKDAQYANSLGMLTYLGLQQYHNNVKKGLLTDDTIMLWTEGALADVKIPPGPRLKILYHLQEHQRRSRNGGSVAAPPGAKA